MGLKRSGEAAEPFEVAVSFVTRRTLMLSARCNSGRNKGRLEGRPKLLPCLRLVARSRYLSRSCAIS